MKVYLDTIGCRLNQSEIEIYAREFRSAGHILVATADEADLVVINTCAVTTAAASDSRQKARQAARAGVKRIALTGCWATLNPEDAAALPNVTHVLPNPIKDQLVGQLLEIPNEEFDLQPVEREPLPGAHGRTRAFIKVQDGCDNRCTFCVTTLARGAGRSSSIERVLSDIQAAIGNSENHGANGNKSDAVSDAKEIVLTGVHLGSWGKDLDGSLHLTNLIEAILVQTSVPRVRLSSLEPWDLSPDFFQLWKDPRLCRHLHLPLQSGCGATLRRMARKITPDSYAHLIASARAAVPEIAITTDIITGFPGESEQEFAESLAFVREMDFAGGHVFTYSARPDTAAARMPGQVPHSKRKERNALMRQALAESADRYQEQFVGQELDVLWESTTPLDPDTWEMKGLTDNYLRVTAEVPSDLWNQISRVRLTGSYPDGFVGEVIR